MLSMCSRHTHLSSTSSLCPAWWGSMKSSSPFANAESQGARVLRDFAGQEKPRYNESQISLLLLCGFQQ